MGETQKVEVKIISTELVKPSSPTPSHLKHFTLSYVDQIIPIVPPFLTAVILFYTATPQTQPLDVTRLKTSLSQTLTKFYPLTGRIKQPTITCNDEGIPFIEAHLNCPLSIFLYSSPKPKLLSKLLPPPESLGLVGNQHVSELTHISIQVSTFTCGGVAIGWYDIHKLTDGISSANFINYWASLASQRCDENSLVQPDFTAAIATFPPSSDAQPLSTVNNDHVPEHCSVVVKSFLFRDAAIGKLKPKAVSHQVPNPSRFLTVAGFIWEQALASKTAPERTPSVSNNNEHRTAVTLNLDMRPRINPVLPQGAIGNLVTGTVACAEMRCALPVLVANMDAAVRRKKDEIRDYYGEKGVEAMRENWNKLLATQWEYKDRAYKITSWCKVGFSDLDFGFGKPKWIVPTDGNINSYFRNLIILNDYSDSDGNGIEAWLFLEEKELQNLESNLEFVAFASPVF